MDEAAAAPCLVQVMLDPPCGDQRDLHLLQRPGRPEVRGGSQVRAAPARPGRVMVADLIRDRPAHRRPGSPGLLALLPLPCPLSGAPLLARRRTARAVIP